VCDPFLGTNYKDIFAAGDIASFFDLGTASRQRIQQWSVAESQGRIAALNMMGVMTPFVSTPWFSMRIYNKEIVKIGGDKPYCEVHMAGSWVSGKLMAYYIDKQDRVVGFASMGQAKKTAELKALLESNKMPSGTQVKQSLV
jgi:apoptosis-inducing factor 3